MRQTRGVLGGVLAYETGLVTAGGLDPSGPHAGAVAEKQAVQAREIQRRDVAEVATPAPARAFLA